MVISRKYEIEHTIGYSSKISFKKILSRWQNNARKPWWVKKVLTATAGVDERELLRKEMADLRRAVSEELYEKEAVQKTANELRGAVKNLEADKVDNARAIHDLKQRIARACIDCFSVLV